MRAWQHGTEYAYRRKECRCGPCVEAHKVELERSRLRKASYAGSCRLCGAATSGSNGRSAAPDICQFCSADHYGPKWAAARRGNGPVVEAALEFLSQPRRYMEVATHLGITKDHCGVTLHRLRKYGMIKRVRRGVYVRVVEQ